MPKLGSNTHVTVFGLAVYLFGQIQFTEFREVPVILCSLPYTFFKFALLVSPSFTNAFTSVKQLPELMYALIGPFVSLLPESSTGDWSSGAAVTENFQCEASLMRIKTLHKDLKYDLDIKNN